MDGTEQSNVDPADSGFAVTTKQPEKRIKRCSRIGIQQRCAKGRTGRHTAKRVSLVIS